MSTGTNNKTRVGNLPPDIYLPTNDPELFHEVINERERDTGVILNQKENGVYVREEVQTSQLWFSADPQVERNGFRRTYEIETLVTGPNTQAHDLDITTYTFTNIFGTLTDGSTHIPIPNGEGGTGNSVNISVDSTNIIINITAGYSGYSGLIVLEYLKT